ncbi:hypothetical protein AB0383_07675 [Amycolatopsis sp. NPDC051373]|uniref:hypothetical protein n=1 Tax=Amycolatopsis sp. NPDC051373 TaxID=3155801 RepID=UPI003450C3D0
MALDLLDGDAVLLADVGDEDGQRIPLRLRRFSTEVYVPSFSMPIALSFWPGQCAARTIWLPLRSASRLPWRPSMR